MAKRRPDRRVVAGLARLDEWGLDAEASVPVLVEHFGREGDADLAIAHVLGGIASAESSAALVALAKTAQKESAKAIKRALYRLEQSGVEVRREQVEVRRPVKMAAEIEGWVSPFDGRGDRLMWLVKPRPGGALHVCAVANDPGGLRELEVNRVSRKALREMREELERKHEIPLVRAEWQRVDFLIRQAQEWARESNAELHGTDYSVIRAQLTSEAALEEWPDPIERLGLQGEPSGEHLEQSAEILLEPELRTWVLSEEEVQPVLDELSEARSSPLVLNQAQEEDRYQAIHRKVTENIFFGEHSQSWIRRMREMSYYFTQTRRELRAEQCVAVAAALARGDAASPVIPFCGAYVALSLALHVEFAEEQREEERESSLIVTPQEFRDQQRRR